MKVIKAINNNNLCVLDDEGREQIVSGKGIGFGKKYGDTVEPAQIEKTYLITDSTGAPIEDFSGFIYGNLISALFISLCIFIIYFLISFLSEKVAKYSAAILFSTMSLCEIALIIYHKTTFL